MDASDSPESEANDAEAPPSLIARLIASWMGLSMKINGPMRPMRDAVETGMTIQQIAALHILMFEGPCSISQLTELLRLSVSATSHLVQRLVEAGYVRRFEDETDRRSKLVSLTADGKKLVERMMKTRLEELKASAAHLSSALRGELKPVLERVVEELSWKAGEAWARRAQPPPRDFRGKDMCGTDLAGQDLSGAVFTDARLDGSDLDGATCIGASFTRSRLDGSSLDGAAFTGASFVDARLDGSSADGAIFDGADLSGARFDGCSLDGASFDGAVARGARFDGSSLDGASFRGADLRDARLDGCALDGACFEGALNVPRNVAARLDARGFWRD